MNHQPLVKSSVPELDDSDDVEIVAVKGAPLPKGRKHKKARVQPDPTTESSTLLLATETETVEDLVNGPSAASGSTTVATDTSHDKILLSEKKARKRKRKDLDGKAQQDGESLAAMLPYDYDASPSILDQGSNDATARQDKQTKKRKSDKGPKQHGKSQPYRLTIR